ncbi:unnamed protein product [Dibothriocephalus latus]|uniref:Uncharacterized protein n=1 Tax=Dibothriocephalus latus TaxID=60516 RepID=A0A3P7LDU3_DIBLA|nr:unnamed protein product [Dibothriocephalus latus]
MFIAPTPSPYRPGEPSDDLDVQEPKKVHKDVSPERRPVVVEETTVAPTTPESKKGMDLEEPKAKTEETKPLAPESPASTKASPSKTGQDAESNSDVEEATKKGEPHKPPAQVASVKREEVSLPSVDTRPAASEASTKTPNVPAQSSTAPSRVTTPKEPPTTSPASKPSDSKSKPTEPVSTESSKPSSAKTAAPPSKSLDVTEPSGSSVSANSRRRIAPGGERHNPTANPPFAFSLVFPHLSSTPGRKARTNPASASKGAIKSYIPLSAIPLHPWRLPNRFLPSPHPSHQQPFTLLVISPILHPAPALNTANQLAFTIRLWYRSHFVTL